MNPAVRRMRLMVDAAGGAACLAVCGGLVVCGILPARQARVSAAAQVRQLAVQQQRVGAARNQVASLDQELRGKQTLLAGSRVRLQSPHAINRRLARINELATQYGLEVQTIEPGELTKGPQYQSVALKLSGVGKYQGCVQFLHALQQESDVSVGSFRFTSDPHEAMQEHGAILAFSLDLRWFAALTDSAPSPG